MSIPPDRPSPLVRVGRFLGLVGPPPRPVGSGASIRVPDARDPGGSTGLSRALGLAPGDDSDPRPDLAALRAELDSLRGEVRRLERRLRQVEREV